MSLCTPSLWIAGLTAGALVMSAPAWAASSSSGSVGPGKSSTAWSGQSYVAGATASPGRLRCRWRRPLR